MSSFEGPIYVCYHCGRATSAQHNLTALAGVLQCSGCGLNAQEDSFKMQDELANMFKQNMNLSNQQTPAVQVQQSERPPVTYSISQHYHHSMHVVAQPPQPVISEPQVQSPEVSVSDRTKEILVQHNVDPSCLLSSQLTLFEQAAPDQRSRLIELWRIAPPDYVSYGAQELDDELGDWMHTTVEQEEAMARLRYQRNTVLEGYTPVSQEEVATAADHHNAEPYIQSGYEALAERDYNKQAVVQANPKDASSPMGSAVKVEYQQAYDPAFQGREWWRHQEMENQYGAFEMNQFRHVTGRVGCGFGQHDEEML